MAHCAVNDITEYHKDVNCKVKHGFREYLRRKHLWYLLNDYIYNIILS